MPRSIGTYIDTRPRGSNGVYQAEVLGNDVIRLMNVETWYTTLCPGHDFRKHFEPIRW